MVIRSIASFSKSSRSLSFKFLDLKWNIKVSRFFLCKSKLFFQSNLSTWLCIDTQLGHFQPTLPRFKSAMHPLWNVETQLEHLISLSLSLWHFQQNGSHLIYDINKKSNEFNIYLNKLIQQHTIASWPSWWFPSEEPSLFVDSSESENRKMSFCFFWFGES